MILLNFQIFTLVRKKHSRIFVDSDLMCPFIKFSINTLVTTYQNDTEVYGCTLFAERSGSHGIFLIALKWWTWALSSDFKRNTVELSWLLNGLGYNPRIYGYCDQMLVWELLPCMISFYCMWNRQGSSK